MKSNSKKPSRQSNEPSYPIPAYLDFVPGGIDYDPTASSQERNWYDLNLVTPDVLVAKAHAADETLRKFAIRYACEEANRTTDDTVTIPHRLPSLSILAEAVFGPLTGVSQKSTRRWADAMVMAYLDDENGDASESKDDILAADEETLLNEFQQVVDDISPLYCSSKPPSAPNSPIHSKKSLVSVLKAMHKKHVEKSNLSNNPLSPMPVRPCGYVFKRNDIAWNCRTCQTDSTCVLCDTCFHNSDHEGHEVYFHRTSPGGCCDCGDVEAWRAEGCCPAHRPRDFNLSNDEKMDDSPTTENVNAEDIKSILSGLSEEADFEAVKASLRGRADGDLCIKEMLPPKFAAALGIVIGAAVQTTIQAIDGAAIGSDPVQWTRRWADQTRKLRDGCAVDEEYVLKTKSPCAYSVGDAMKLELPSRTQLHLRLHNDDVHTYEEVIESLYHSQGRMFTSTNRQSNGSAAATTGIVNELDEAKELTTHVDSDGQVIVKGYTTIEDAKVGYNRLKTFGLHCAIISTPQVDLEVRSRILLSWLSDISAAHPAVAALVVHALVDVTEGSDPLGGAYVWPISRMIPPWSFTHGYFTSARVSIHEEDEKEEEIDVPSWRRRMDVFPPNLKSSFLTREESRQLHKLGLAALNEISSPKKGVDLKFYTQIPYTLPSPRYRKSPHSLWGIMPSPFTVPQRKYSHPLLCRDNTSGNKPYYLSESLVVLETDLRKQQETDMLIHDGYTHSLLGLHMISGVGQVDVEGDEHGGSAMKPTVEEWQQLLSISSYRAPVSPILLMLLLDPYPPKQLRAAVHPLFLSLLIDSRMKSRFAASLGGIAYRSLTTLFCSGVGTEGDSPLAFTVQIFTVGSLVRALCNVDATTKLLSFDGDINAEESCVGFEDALTTPVAQNIVRCIHTNLLGACKEVKMVLKNTLERRKNNDGSMKELNKHLSALIYQHGETPDTTLLPAAPDDAFLDARSTKHKRLPPLIRDLEYIFETPGTALRLLLPSDDGNSTDTSRTLQFPTMWCRLLRLAQGVDTLKRKISGGHVEYEQMRWLEAYSLSLHFAGACSKLAESLSKHVSSLNPPSQGLIRDGMGNCFAAILREMKWWLYNEYILDSGLPQKAGDSQVDALQRSTLHVSMSTLGVATASSDDVGRATALNCQTNTKMTEVHLEMIESAMRIEQSQYQLNCAGRGAIMSDWLRVPHSPHAGDALSFHLPLHRSLARNIRSLCSLVVPEDLRESNSLWWILPTLDSNILASDNTVVGSLEHPLSGLLRSSLKSSNCRVTWAAGPECDSEEAKRRRSRARDVSAAITASKIIHSLCDHPLRCLAASEQISRHLWARNGGAAAGMAINYSSPPLCQSFRDLDLTMVQLSASGMSIGLGARRVFSLLLSRFDLDGFLCDPEKKVGNRSPTNNNFGTQWVMPPILQDPDHAPSLAEALFTTICIMVTELPPPPPLSKSDDTPMRMHVRRGLLHSLAVNPLSYSKAMEAATNAITRKDVTNSFDDEDGPSSFRTVFGEVLREISSQKSLGSRLTAAPSFELNCNVSDEYDPSFFHLKRADHQQAMDNIARLRKQKFFSKGKRNSGKCLPLVGPPPDAHPRFMPCRMLLHIPALDASVRRSLMYTLTGGEWLPPNAPHDTSDDSTLESPSFSSEMATADGKIVRTASRRVPRVGKGRKKKPKFSPEVVNNSSVSFLEVLQLLTLQIHTLEACASLHRTHPNLDHEAKSLSASMSINSYLGRLVHVPSSLVDAWAFRCYPDGPLNSSGSGLNRASILGLLIALYEHRSDNTATTSEDVGHGEDGLGGARFLVSSGLKWLLRFVSALVDGAPSVRIACESALEGVPIEKDSRSLNNDTVWTIDTHLQSTIAGMLENLPDLWPSEDSKDAEGTESLNNGKSREAMKAAQVRAMERMKKQQASFAASISTDEKNDMATKESDEDADLCIICRCDDDDGGNSGPMGFLGHVQRSRTIQLRSRSQSLENSSNIALSYRVVGDMGCQIRAQKSMDSAPVECIPVGSLVTVVNTKVTPTYGLKSRRVLVRYTSPLDGKMSEGWASVQSSQGYTILSPLIDVCYTNSRWGCTRPIIRQCGHAAHLLCVEAHVASIHQKAQQETPFDGRFAAEIGDGEFLCPLCKQLSNIVVPVEENDKSNLGGAIQRKTADEEIMNRFDTLKDTLVKTPRGANMDGNKRTAIKQYGTYLYQAMEVTSWGGRKPRTRQPWHTSLTSWDFTEEGNDYDDTQPDDESAPIGDILQLLRQLHIAWSSAGHGAAAAEASVRGVKKEGFEPPTNDPWIDFNAESHDTHPMVLELRRTLLAAASLVDVVSTEIAERLCDTSKVSDGTPIIGFLLFNIINGTFWTSMSNENDNHWSALTSLLTSIPCHVSRDETLSPRYEARATAAQIWAIKGDRDSIAQRNSHNEAIEEEAILSKVKKSRSPTPKCVRHIPDFQKKLAHPWGTMNPEKAIADGMTLFRPAFASGFLYMPLLSWDLDTFAGALFSTLSTTDDLDTEHVCDVSRILLVARMVQVLITQHGFNILKDNPAFECEMNINEENDAIMSLFHHLKLSANPGWKSGDEEDANNLLASVSYAILPYARTLVLLLRSVFSTVRLKGYDVNAEIETFIEDEDTMYIEDGFYFMEKLGCPLPSEIMKSLSTPTSGNSESIFWGNLVKRWIDAVVSFDAYHGSEGGHLEFSQGRQKWVPVAPTINSNKKLKSERLPVKEEVTANNYPDDEMQLDVMFSGDSNALDINEDEIMGDDDDSSEENQVARFDFDQVDSALDMGIDFEDDEVMDNDADMQEVFGLPSLPSQPSQDTSLVNHNDEASVFSSGNDDGDIPNDDHLYASISSAAIIPYQPCILGNKKPGPGPRGNSIDYSVASNLMSDLSHLGTIHSAGVEGSGLIQLPKSYVELYTLVNKVKATVKNAALDDMEDLSNGETAICLITGAIMRAGLPRRQSRRVQRPPGACTLHARSVGSGTGIFFLLQKCTVLLVHNKKSAYSASLYVDENGEEDTGIARGRPLFLKGDRYMALESMWRSHGIPREVAQIRSTSDRVIRDNWY